MRRQRNQVGTTGTIAVKKQHNLFGATTRQWLQARTVYDLGQNHRLIFMKVQMRILR